MMKVPPLAILLTACVLLTTGAYAQPVASHAVEHEVKGWAEDIVTGANQLASGLFDGANQAANEFVDGANQLNDAVNTYYSGSSSWSPSTGWPKLVVFLLPTAIIAAVA